METYKECFYQAVADYLQDVGADSDYTIADYITGMDAIDIHALYKEIASTAFKMWQKENMGAGAVQKISTKPISRLP